MIAVRAVLHTSMVARDLDRVASFYTGVLGAQLLKLIDIDTPDFGRGVGLPGASARIAHLLLAGGALVLEIIQYRDPVAAAQEAGAANVPGFRHLAFQVDDMSAAFRRVGELGVATESEKPVTVTTTSAQGIQFLYIRDPEGNLIELIQLPQTPARGD